MRQPLRQRQPDHRRAAGGGRGRRLRPRSELAPCSDIDLLFLCPYKRTPHVEQIAEFLLYKLWDLGLKVGQAIRSVGETHQARQERPDGPHRPARGAARSGARPHAVRPARSELTSARSCAGRGAAFVEAKLAERDQRHQRMGDSRFLLEPNIKEGKGGLRDLQTLLVDRAGSLPQRRSGRAGAPGSAHPASRSARFLRSRRFLWTVRCHLHYLTGRAEERLTFDLQPEIARRMGYRERNRVRARRALHEALLPRRQGCGRPDPDRLRGARGAAASGRPRFGLPRFGFGRRRVNGFVIQGNRLASADSGLFEREPIADARAVPRRPGARARHPPAGPGGGHATISAGSTSGCARIPEANRLFLDMLCSRKDPALTLTRMNEAGLLGRFVPDFGRIVAQMQHNLYHVYTVDEHTIRAIGILSQIENGQLADELPLSTEVMPKLLSRRELYVAVPSCTTSARAAAATTASSARQIAKRLCPRLGPADDATETVAWLVAPPPRHEPLRVQARQRGPADDRGLRRHRAVARAAEAAAGADRDRHPRGRPQRLERLEGPAAARALPRGRGRDGRRAIRRAAARARIERAKDKLARGAAPARRRALDRRPRSTTYLARHDPRYWLGFPTDEHLRHAADRRRRRRASGRRWRVDFRVDEFRARTEMLLYAADHPGLFMKVAGALALSGVSIVDAHIFTTADGMALDTLGFQDADQPARGRPTRPGSTASATTSRRRCAARSGSRRRSPGGAACPSGPTCSRSSRAC